MVVLRRDPDRAYQCLAIYGIVALLLGGALDQFLSWRYFLYYALVATIYWLFACCRAAWWDDRILKGRPALGLIAGYSAMAGVYLGSRGISRFDERAAAIGALIGFTVGIPLFYLTRPLMRRSLRRMRTFVTPGRCAFCDYPLYGLTATRCPECGLEFDAHDLGRREPPADA